MSSSHTYCLKRPLPLSVSTSRAISLLHEHSNIITLSPLVIEHHALSVSHGSSAGLSTTYSITDHIDYLPCGLFARNVTVTAEFSNQSDGTTTIRHAPLGFIIKERWSVQDSLEDLPKQPSKELVLTIELVASKLILPLFKNMMEKNHNGYINGMAKVILEDQTTITTWDAGLRVISGLYIGRTVILGWGIKRRIVSKITYLVNN